MPKRTLMTVVALGVAVACSTPDPGDQSPGPGSESPDPNGAPSTLLEFDAEAVALGPRRYGPELGDLRGHWVYDPTSRRTNVHVSGKQGDWRVGIDLVVPVDGPGLYRSNPSHGGIDRSFFLSLANHATGRRIALVSRNATVELRRNPLDPKSLSGRFSGEFAIGARTTGRDILQIPMAQRKYAQIREGRFVAPYRDILSGRGRPWPEPGPGAPSERTEEAAPLPTGATRR